MNKLAALLFAALVSACASPPTAQDDQEVGRTRIRVNSFICILAFCQHEMEVADSQGDNTQGEGSQDADLKADVAIPAEVL